jgi:cholesterol oxidase
MSPQYDYVIIGSGFGGAVSALRLAEKGYKVLVIEKGKRFDGADFPVTNWHLRKWLWLPFLKMRGSFKIDLFRHVVALSGVGVGGGSLVYGGALPDPPTKFFHSGHWQGLADWEAELKPFYAEARRMLGGATNPKLEAGDLAMLELATEMGREKHFSTTEVGIFFGEPDKKVKDPYFNGDGPDRSGCNFCGGCLLGCRYNAKNSVDKNYLFLAEQLGVKVLAASEVYDIIPLDAANGNKGYEVKYRTVAGLEKITSQGIIFSGGVLGTVKLLLKLKSISLPRLSSMVGEAVRTNNESIIGVINYKQNRDLSQGIAIGSIFKVDDTSYVEPFRHSKGAGAWRLFLMPLAHGKSLAERVGIILTDFIKHPIKNLKAIFVDDFALRTQALLFMQQGEQSLRLKRGIFGLKSVSGNGEKLTPFMPLARRLSQQYAEKIEGKPYVFATEALLGIPTTAHLLGGAVMGSDITNGVIDKDNRVFGYENMLVCDGAMISSNPGVNPALTITAITERAMSKIKPK